MTRRKKRAVSPTSRIRKLTKVGGRSIAVTIPIDIVRELKWREHQKVVVHRHGEKIIIEDWKP